MRKLNIKDPLLVVLAEAAVSMLTLLQIMRVVQELQDKEIAAEQDAD